MRKGSTAKGTAEIHQKIKNEYYQMLADKKLYPIRHLSDKYGYVERQIRRIVNSQ